MLSTGCIRSHEQQVAMLGSAAGIDPVKFPRRYAKLMARKGKTLDIEIMSRRQIQAVQDEEKMTRVRELAKTHCITEVEKLTGISRKRLVSLAEEHEITFPEGRGRAHLARYEVHAAKLRAYLAIGLTRREAIKASELDPRIFKKVCQQFEIQFPETR
ncbi:hypothetical protein thsps21_12870 [Pseudomonas sp. No.21]|jgi:hypothetical protein|nr:MULTISPECIES: hypothetical protein [Pseudomonas]MDW3712906.1 hypothetical protein [Pseudomonas sp. 2023EL-01195]GJN44925.1 hypothetical protein TUM20249_09110 [Pseudomonas tohonis]